MRIAYHDDARGLAINVKVRHLSAGSGSEEQIQRAWDEAQACWWSAARDIAKRHGFQDVYSAGRQGGWLYTAPLPDAEYPEAFVDDLSALLRHAPQMFADALYDVRAEDE